MYRWRYSNLKDHSISNIITKLDGLSSSTLCVNVKPDKNVTGEINPAEYKKISAFVTHLTSKGVSYDQITILSPYRKQKNYISERMKDIKVYTVDEFQGKENDIILVSMAFSGKRASPFLCDERRINVLTSRAKQLFVLFANLDALTATSAWKPVLDSISKSQERERKEYKISPPNSPLGNELDKLGL